MRAVAPTVGAMLAALLYKFSMATPSHVRSAEYRD